MKFAILKFVYFYFQTPNKQIEQEWGKFSFGRNFLKRESPTLKLLLHKNRINLLR